MAMTRFGTMAAALATVAILAGCGGGGGSPGGEPRMEPAPKPQPKEPEAELRGTRIAEISGVIDSLDDVDTFEAPVTGPGLLVIGISNEDFNVRVLTPDGQEIPTYRGSFLANINDAIWEAVTEKAGEAADEVRESRPVKFLVEVAARGKRAVGRAYSAEVDYVTDIGIICTEYGLPEAEAVTVCNTGSVAPPEPSVVLPEPKKNLGQIRQMAVNRGHHSHLGEGAAVAAGIVQISELNLGHILGGPDGAPRPTEIREVGHGLRYAHGIFNNSLSDERLQIDPSGTTVSLSGATDLDVIAYWGKWVAAEIHHLRGSVMVDGQSTPTLYGGATHVYGGTVVSAGLSATYEGYALLFDSATPSFPQTADVSIRYTSRNGEMGIDIDYDDWCCEYTATRVERFDTFTGGNANGSVEANFFNRSASVSESRDEEKEVAGVFKQSSNERDLFADVPDLSLPFEIKTADRVIFGSFVASQDRRLEFQ